MLQDSLEKYLRRRGLYRNDARIFAHLLPLLESSAWANNRVGGNGWLAVGDAAGLVDPLTGEGLYYAIRSADLACRIILEAGQVSEDQASTYRALLRNDFAAGLECSAVIARRFFNSRFLLGSLPARMVQLARFSPVVNSLMRDLLAGLQPYINLRERICRNTNRNLQEIIMYLMFRDVIQDRNLT